MDKLIIGSTALKYWFPDYPKEPKDIDFIVSVNDIQHNKKGEEYLENIILWENKELYFKNNYILPNILYTLKLSHLIGWNINWEKHLFHVQFLKKKGCSIEKELFYKLYNYWNIIHNKNKRSDLNQSAENFFTNKVDSPHEHDYLHTLINPSPTFKKILIDEVEVCDEKINKLSFEEKCELIREEVMVMASERYKGMLDKFIISHAPIEVGIFALENYPLLERPLYNFMEVINSKLKEQGLQTLN